MNHSEQDFYNGVFLRLLDRGFDSDQAASQAQKALTARRAAFKRTRQTQRKRPSSKARAR